MDTDLTICRKIAEDFPGLSTRMDERERLGLARYGKPLDPDDGRNWIAEASEEIADALVYLTAAGHRIASADQSPQTLAHWAMIRRMRRALADMLGELEGKR